MVQFDPRKHHRPRYLNGSAITFLYPVAAIIVLVSPCVSLQQYHRRQTHCARLYSGVVQDTGTALHAKIGGSAGVAGGNKNKNGRSLESSLHRRNVFQGSYNMEKLCDSFPDLTPFIRPGHASRNFRSTIDFSDPKAVRALNAALLAHDYGIYHWQEFLPPSSLTPPIPGRADYIHHIADVLLSSSSRIADTQLHNTDSDDNAILLPIGPNIRGLDIGTGASLIFPLLGTRLYGWTFVASESDPVSTLVARQIAAAASATPEIGNDSTIWPNIEVRQQPDKNQILRGIIGLEEEIDFCMCNPPFYESKEAYQKENDRKIRNLKRNNEKRNTNGYNSAPNQTPTAALASSTTGSNNFSGGASELWYPGGEVAFLSILIQESRTLAHSCLWFSSLVSRRDHLPTLQTILRNSHVKETRIVEMSQGQKSSSLLFWTFHNRTEQAQWCERRKWQFGNQSFVKHDKQE